MVTFFLQLANRLINAGASYVTKYNVAVTQRNVRTDPQYIMGIPLLAGLQSIKT